MPNRLQKVGTRQVDFKSNQIVTRPIARLEREISHKIKRPKKFTPTRMRNGINNYFAHCEENDDVPSISGLMIFLKLSRDAFYQYKKYPEFGDMMEQAALHISNWCATDVYKTKGQAAGKIAYMKNIHNWSEKIQSENFNTNETRITTVEEATAKISALAPVLLEVLKSRNLTNQLVIDVQPERVVQDA